MTKELIGLLFLAFVPAIILVIAGTVSAVRNYGVAFLWCLRFEPVREKLTSIVREMHPEAPVVSEAVYAGQQDFGTVVPVVATRGRSHSAPPVHRCSY
ncbi:MAG: hypothetical protein ACT4QB_14840 [Gammaproteobacteria bacterium]